MNNEKKKTGSFEFYERSNPTSAFIAYSNFLLLERD